MPSSFEKIVNGLRDGSIVPVLGPEALAGAVHAESGRPLPADSDSLIEAMMAGRPLHPKVAYEFSRAAMHMELKRGRSFVTRFLSGLYSDPAWSRASLHDWLATIKPPYVIDINRDTQLQASYADTPHTLIVGISRIGGTDYRFRLYQNDGNGSYREITQEEADADLPILFKPLGTPQPDDNYVASDADYVDYITELMGGFAIPGFLKSYRRGRRYLLLGLRLTRDTERMVLGDILYDAAEPAGWALLPTPAKNERRFCDKHNLEIIEAVPGDLFPELRLPEPATV